MSTLRARPMNPVLFGTLMVASAAVAFSAHLPDDARAGLVAGYLLLAPGYAVLPFLGRDHRVLHTMLALGIGVSFAILLSTAMSETGWWHPTAGVWLTVAVVVLVSVARIWHDRSDLAARVSGRQP